MIKLILFLFTLFISIIQAKDYNFDSRGFSKQSTISFNDDSKYTQLETVGWWTDSRGNYGTEKCFGKIEVIKDEIKLDILCELIDQVNNKLRVSRKRNSLEGGGVGINTYLETSARYKDLLNKKCTYAVTNLKEHFFYKQKCSLQNNNLLNSN